MRDLSSTSALIYYSYYSYKSLAVLMGMATGIIAVRVAWVCYPREGCSRSRHVQSVCDTPCHLAVKALSSIVYRQPVHKCSAP